MLTLCKLNEPRFFRIELLKQDISAKTGFLPVIYFLIV
jgi:hypothetical protein